MENNEGWIFFNIFRPEEMSKLQKYISICFEDEMQKNYPNYNGHFVISDIALYFSAI